MVFEKKYFLRSDVTSEEVFDCLTVFMDPCSTCVQKNIAHKKLEVVDDNGFSRWVKREKESEYNLMEFTCYEDKKDSSLDLKIWFNLNVTDAGKGKVHLLEVEFKETNNEKRIFQFFNRLEKLVPKAYKQTELKNAYTEMLRSEKNREIEDFYIEFKSDRNREYFFPKAYVNNLLKDLWFLGIDFQTSTYEDYLKVRKEQIARDYENSKTKFGNTFASKGSFKSFEDKFLEREAKKYVDEEAQIIIEDRFEGTRIILGKTDCGNSYEELKAKIISSVDEVREKSTVKNYFTWEGLELFKREEPEEKNDTSVLLEIQKETNERLKEEIQKLTELYNKSQLQNEALKEENKNLTEDLVQERSEKMELAKKMASLSDSHQDNQFFDYLALEEKYKDTLKTVDHLQNTLAEIEAKKLAEQQAGNSGYVELKIPCSLKNLFSDELEDFLYKTLYDACKLKLKVLPENEKVEVTRLRDVLENILKNKVFDDEKCNTKGLKNRVFASVKDVKHIDKAALVADGFIFDRQINNHIVSYFRDKRYEMVFPSTGSDTSHGGKNLFNDVSNRIFMF